MYNAAYMCVGDTFKFVAYKEQPKPLYDGYSTQKSFERYCAYAGGSFQLVE